MTELQTLAKEAFGIVAHTVIEQIIYVKNPPRLKKSTNYAQLENGTNEQIVTHLEREIEPNSIEDPDKLQIYLVSRHSTNTNAEEPKLMCHHCKKPRQYRSYCRLLEKQREQT